MALWTCLIIFNHRDVCAGNFDANLCSDSPINGLTALTNGTILIFKGQTLATWVPIPEIYVLADAEPQYFRCRSNVLVNVHVWQREN